MQYYISWLRISIVAKNKLTTGVSLDFQCGRKEKIERERERKREREREKTNPFFKGQTLKP